MIRFTLLNDIGTDIDLLTSTYKCTVCQLYCVSISIRRVTLCQNRYIHRQMTYTDDMSVITMGNNNVYIVTQDYKNIVDKVNNNIRFLKSELVSCIFITCKLVKCN